jgi:hypothetical protein
MSIRHRVVAPTRSAYRLDFARRDHHALNIASITTTITPATAPKSVPATAAITPSVAAWTRRQREVARDRPRRERQHQSSPCSLSAR